MIGEPMIAARCDGTDEEKGGQCRSGEAFALPGLNFERGQLTALFLALHPGWAARTNGIFCPRCVTRGRNAAAAAVVHAGGCGA